MVTESEMSEEHVEHIDPDALHDIVEHKGILAHRGGTGSIDFQFTYLGYPFAVRAEAGAQGSTVNIRAVLGYLPYTAESMRGRLGAMAVLYASSQALGQRVRLGEQQRLIMSDKRTTKDTLTPVNLMTLMVAMLLEAKPYLKLLSHYVTPASTGDVVEVATDSTADAADEESAAIAAA